MTIEQIREAMHRQPYVPFVVRTVEGQAYEVGHPDFIATSTNGRVVTVFDDVGQHILDVRLVVEITFPQVQES
jgi:hypothetical protein